MQSRQSILARRLNLKGLPTIASTVRVHGPALPCPAGPLVQVASTYYKMAAADTVAQGKVKKGISGPITATHLEKPANRPRPVHVPPGRHPCAPSRSRFICSLALRRLQPLRYLHDCSGCFPAGAVAGWGLHPPKAPSLHGACQERSLVAHSIASSAGIGGTAS